MHLVPDPFNPSGEPLDSYLDKLFQQFLSDLVQQRLPWQPSECNVAFRRYEEIDGRHASFWHLVTGGSSTEIERAVEPERCRRLSWIRPMIEAFNQDYPDENQILWWKCSKERGNGRRYGIATQDYGYVLFVDERNRYALFVTAYFVEQSRRRRKLRAEHDEFWQQQKQEPHA